ncbi:MAG: PAS domain S-box protein [Phycisphaerae bacterium]|nr:PAS domain S-box protein [Phycisphaerae bacterium]
MESTKYKILLVEDDKLDQKAFERLVKKENLPYDYTIASSVAEAKNILGRELFDVVISDYTLGDGTAFDVLEVVKNTPTIIITGNGNEEVAINAWKAGAYDYLMKDLERNYLKTLPITVDNVAQRKKTEERVELLSGAIMSTDDSVYITDMENKIVFVNKAFCETYGYQEEEVKGRDSNILWIGKLQHKGCRSVFQVVSSAWEVGFYHKRKNGSVFPVSLSRSIIKDLAGNEVAVVGVVRDITERIIMEDELRTANQTLQKRSLLKNELAVAVSEELKNSIAKIEDIISDAATSAPNEIEPKLKENLELVQKNIDGTKSIINDFLEASNIGTNKAKLEIGEIAICSLIDEVVEAISPLAAEKNITLESSLPDSELLVNADHDKISQILINLITNSINSSPENGHINVRAEDLGNEITIEVQDDSPTIKSGDENKIFNRFDQIRKQLRAGKEELSLALPIAKELVELHGGWIWAEGRDNKGNSFCFTLPKANAQPLAAATNSKYPQKLNQNRTPK